MVTFSNPFHWGICIVADSEMEDVPTLAGDAGRSRTALVIPVHDPTVEHADVVVRCHEEPAPGRVRVEAVIEVPSGQLEVGDANRNCMFAIPTRRCRIQIAAMPWGAASTIDVWIVPIE